jgi:signal transduction histidine kinase
MKIELLADNNKVEGWSDTESRKRHVGNLAQRVNRVVSERWHIPAVLALVLVASSFYNYLLFHTLLELLTVLIATAALIVTWHTYPSSRNHYLMVLGCGYFWVGALDFVHTLAYKGMHVLPSVTTSNEPTQFWIAARFSAALLLLVAPFFVTRPMRRIWIFALFGVIAVVLGSLIMSGHFPDCFIDGRGLTPFKIYSEYVIIAILVVAMANLWRRRALMDEGIAAGILLANVFTMGAEFSFTQYASVYGPANLIGHISKLFAFWMIYCVLVEFAFRRPELTPQRDDDANRPVSRAFWPLAVGSVLLPLIMFGVVAWQSYQTEMREAEREVQRTGEVFYGHALNVFQTDELIAERVSDRLAGMTWDQIEQSKDLQNFLKNITENFPQAQAIWLADSAGRVRNASQLLPAMPVSVADRDYFKALRERDAGAAIGELVQARVMQGWNFNSARRRGGNGNAFDGVVVVTLFESYFSDFWKRGAPTMDSSVTLMRGDGKILARAPKIEPTVLTIPLNASPLFGLTKNTDQGTYRLVSNSDGVDRLYAFHKLPKYDVLLVYGVGVHTALAEWRTELLAYAALFGCAALTLLMFSLLAQRSAHQAEIRERSVILEQRVLERTAELKAANQELEAFTYSASHDLRAPLRSIDGFAKVLEEDYAQGFDAEGKDALHRVRAAAQRMGELIDALLSLSRLTRSDMNLEVVDLSALARCVTDKIKASEPERSVVFEIAPKIEVHGDKRLLAVLLENLLGNAWKFTGKRANARIEFGAAVTDGQPAYFVRDDGAGFDMAHAANLFAPFQRLHSVSDFPGTGIGLATVRRIVQRHRGRVWAEGAVDQGATFYFTLSA